MTREHRQNAIQYLFLHLLTTKFVAILHTLTQKCHISQISNAQKVRHLEQPSKFVAILHTLTQKCHISQISNVQKLRHLEQPSRRKTN